MRAMCRKILVWLCGGECVDPVAIREDIQSIREEVAAQGVSIVMLQAKENSLRAEDCAARSARAAAAAKESANSCSLGESS